MQNLANPLQAYDPYQQTKTGTTLAALKYSGGVMLGCDTRTSRGVFISDRVSLKGNMISPDVTRHGHIMVLRCGAASHTQYVTKVVANYLHMHAMELADRPIGKIWGLFLYFFYVLNFNNLGGVMYKVIGFGRFLLFLSC